MLLPYGDTTNDGIIQLSFTLPVAPSHKTKEAALQLIQSWGFTDVRIAHISQVGTGYSFFVAFAKAQQGIDFDNIQVQEVYAQAQSRTYQEIDSLILTYIKRPIRIVGACTGFDAHTVGLDAILNMKGFDGDIGLERYKGFDVTNMGSQVPTQELIDCAIKKNADAILVSKVVSQKDIHVSDLEDLMQSLEKQNLSDRFILVAGGPRVTPQMATELGFDAGFTLGTKPSDVANFLLEKMLEKLKIKIPSKKDI